MTRSRLALLVRLSPAVFAAAGASTLVGCSSDDTSPAKGDASEAGTADQGAPDVVNDLTLPTEAGVPVAEGGPGEASDAGASLHSIQHFVVIYMENHSFDNLYGEFPGADGVTGLDAGSPNVEQRNGPGGSPYATLPFPASLIADGGAFADAGLPNAPFPIEPYIGSSVVLPIDLNHIFFTEQIQIAEGGMNLFVYQSNAQGLAMGYYHTMSLPVPNEAKNWTVCDRFFHSAFGGSFLNHHFLIAAAPPVWDPGTKPLPDADAGVAVFDDRASIPVGQGEGYIWHDATADGGAGAYYVVNTSFSVNSPHAPASGKGLPSYLVPNQTSPTIGDRLSDANIDWAWYSGGWNDALAVSADAGVPEGGSAPSVEKFQYHHQPFIYYAKYADGQPGRAHLKDETDFVAAATSGTLPAVSFVKPVGINNEHPNYTDLVTGDNHLMTLINAVMNGGNRTDTAIIVTYDEHGGFWDHVPPPAGDQWGPGTRVPTIVISPFAKRGFVDHTTYDTSSILATIEMRWSLAPLTSRDQKAPAMLSPFTFSP